MPKVGWRCRLCSGLQVEEAVNMQELAWNKNTKSTGVQYRHGAVLVNE